MSGSKAVAPAWAATVLIEKSTVSVPGASIEVEGQTFQHLFRARRLAENEFVQVVDGRGGRVLARVVAVARRSAELQIEQALDPEPATRPVAVWIAQPKLERASWAVEKLTELAVAEIVFWRSDRSQMDYADRQVERLERVRAAALEQSGGARLPELRCNDSWDDLSRIGGKPAVLDVTGEAPPPELAQVGCLVVGPEGGWSDDERARFEDLGWPRLQIGHRVLRVETAAVVGAGLLLAAG